MNAKIYRPVILKTLKDANTNKPASLEALVDRIVDNMEVFDEMFSLAGGASAMLQAVLPAPPEFISQSSPTFDLSQRIVPKQERTYTDEEIEELRNLGIARLKESLPLFVLVQPPGFDKPIRIINQGPMNSRGAMPFIGSRWAAEGYSQGFSIQQDVTGVMMTVEQVIANVKEQAAALYFSAPKVIQSRIPTAEAGSWSGVIEADTPEQAQQNLMSIEAKMRSQGKSLSD